MYISDPAHFMQDILSHFWHITTQAAQQISSQDSQSINIAILEKTQSWQLFLLQEEQVV
jgi:hypothetical protein